MLSNVDFSNADFLSDVHVNAPFEEVKDGDYAAVTRFKFRMPSDYESQSKYSNDAGIYQPTPTEKRKHECVSFTEETTEINQDKRNNAMLITCTRSERSDSNEYGVRKHKGLGCADNCVSMKLLQEGKQHLPSSSSNSDGSINKQCKELVLTVDEDGTSSSENKTITNAIPSVCPYSNKKRKHSKSRGDSDNKNNVNSSINIIENAFVSTAYHKAHATDSCVQSSPNSGEEAANIKIVLKDSLPGATSGICDNVSAEETSSLACSEQIVDSDSDIEVDRNLPEEVYLYAINIKHSLATSLGNVGEQVWSGALFLCDYMIHRPDLFSGRLVLDLGAGVGLTSIVAAMNARTVFCTDTGEKILTYARENIASIKRCPTLPRDTCPIHVRDLDWCKGVVANETGLCSDLSACDVSMINGCDVILAADVIYDFDLTDAFFATVKSLLKVDPDKTVYIGLEKRLVFSVHDLAITSPVYNYFRLHLDDLSSLDVDLDIGCHVEQISVDFPKYFNYTRNSNLELWKISSGRRSQKDNYPK